ncbi:ABC transporter ATP-binding protein [Actinopolymorpha pittospori]
MASIQEPLLRVEDLKTHFFLDEGVVRAVDGVTFTVPRGKTVCVVGESGCGKSITARSVLGLVESPGRVVSGHVWWNPARPDAPAGADAPAVRSGAEPAAGPATRRRRGRPPRDDDPGRASGPVDLAALDSRGEDLRRIRGNDISMVFQEPMASLSPMYTVAHQLIQAIRVHERADRQEAFERGVSLLSRVGIPRPEQRMDSYPFQLSGGMCQRVMIAIAIACGPSLLIADEPTTALDVTTQARIIDLLRDLQRATGMSMLFITHDLGVVAEVADEVVVMYLGTVVEQGGVDEIFHDPKHPYTRALLASIPTMGAGARRRPTSIRGQVPHPLRRPRGCPFHPRCDSAIPGLCDTVAPPTVDLGDGRRARCVLYDPKLVAEHTRPAPGDRTSDDGSRP